MFLHHVGGGWEKATIHTAPSLQGLPYGLRQPFFVQGWSTRPEVAGKTPESILVCMEA